MTDFVLKATTRKVIGKQVKKLRENGEIPANMYGHDSKNQNLSLNFISFNRIFNDAGTSNLVDLVVDENQPVKVLLKEPDYHPVSNKPLHIDIYKVKMTEKLTTEIPLNFVNESPAVLEQEGSLVTNRDALEVECLPADLVSEFDVDLSLLKTFDDVIKVGDIKVSDKIEILNDLEEIVAQVMPPRSEEELEELDAAVEENVEAVEVTGEKPAEEGEEGVEPTTEAEAKPETEKKTE